MKFTLAAVLLVGLWAAATLEVARAQNVTTWSGVYTDAQAAAGEAAYKKGCAECHQADLAGDGFAPALKGTEFLSTWNGLSVGDLLERIRISMPPNDPDAMPMKEKAEVVAYLLKQSGFPAGKIDLAITTDALKSITIEATKPGRR